MAGFDISAIREPETYLAELIWRKKPAAIEKLKVNIEEVKRVHSRFWKCFR
jgi:hypothetical protein